MANSPPRPVAAKRKKQLPHPINHLSTQRIRAVGHVWSSADGINWTLETVGAAWSPRAGHSSAVFNNRLWVLGGDDNSPQNDVWSSADGVTWTLVAATASWSARYGHTTAVFNNRLWVLGGCDGTTFKNDVWSSVDGANWTLETAAAPWSVRVSHSTEVHNNQLWVLGGSNGSTYYNDVWSSSDGVNWTQATATAPWSIRDQHSTEVFNGRLWVLGGHKVGTYYHDVWSSTDGVNWTQATAAAPWSARFGHTSAVFNSRLWLLGGYDGTNKNDVWSSPDGVTWAQATTTAPWSARGLHTTEVFNNLLWVFGGSGNSGRMNDVWSFLPTGGFTPEMDVTRGATPVIDNGTDSLGSAFAPGVGGSLTYTITNNGSADLNITTLPVAAPGARVNCNATVTTQPNSLVAPAGTTTLVVSITPFVSGTFSCTITIDNDDPSENPYNWTVNGVATIPPTPEIDITRNTTPILDGGSEGLGSLTFGMARTLTYNISNLGNANLNLTGSPNLVAISAGFNVSSVSVTAQPSQSLAPSAATTFEVTYTVAAAGAFGFTISIDNDDANENPYDWSIFGTSPPPPAPEIDISRGITPIANGSSDAIGSVPVGVAQTVTYSVANVGNAVLSLTGAPNLVLVTAGVNVNSVSVTTQPGASVSASATTTFSVTFTVTAASSFDFSISIDNDDPNENPYIWTVYGNGTSSPEMDVSRLAAIADGSTDNIGSLNPGTPVPLSYTITNSGNASLSVTASVAITLTVNCAAVVTIQPGTSVAAGNSTVMAVSVTPAGAGPFSFTVGIVNNDSDENPYDWVVTGTGTTGGSKGTSDSEDTGGCSTESTSAPWLFITGALAALVVALRTRKTCAPDRPLT